MKTRRYYYKPIFAEKSGHPTFLLKQLRQTFLIYAAHFLRNLCLFWVRGIRVIYEPLSDKKKSNERYFSERE